MFFFDHTGFLALIGLFLQAGLSWVFVVMLAAMRAGHERDRFLRGWIVAFLALAVGLSALGVRYFNVFELADGRTVWAEGQPLVLACYAVYLAGKTLFALQLVQGASALAARPAPAIFLRAKPILLTFYCLAPLWLPGMERLLALQAPMMIACSATAFWWLRPGRVPGRRPTDVRFVRFALAGMTLAWALHAVSALLIRFDTPNVWWYVTQFGSYVDLGLEFVLGAGLLVAHLHGTRLEVEQAHSERDRLRREVERNEKLRAIGTLVSGVAHELNNPLTAILGFADLLGTDKAAVVVREQAERCRGIVRSLSALAGDCAQAREPLDGGQVAERVARGLQLQAAAAGVRLELQLAPGVPPILADRIGVEQVLGNLLVNALDATPAGGTVTLRLARTADHLEFAVQDPGPGVPEALRSRIFEPFFTTKPPGRGTGLGLAVAHAIARNHGGELAVQDGPGGVGSCFTFRLPVSGADPAPSSGPAPASAPIPPLHLLLVDDEPAVRLVLRRRAEQHGWHVTEATTAEAAIDLLDSRGGGFDALLCDLRMPGLGGIGLHDHLATHAPQWLRRCVFITGDLASAEVVAFARRCRCPLVQKPFDFDRLLRQITEVAAHAASA